MPLHFCHPEVPHKKLRMPQWYEPTLMMDRALDAVLRRVKSFDCEHDIPYLAGYRQDGKTIYIDRHTPPSFKFRGRTIETDRFLVPHEEVKKMLIDQLGLHDPHARQIATRADQAAVRAGGVSRQAYDRFMQKCVKRAGDERLSTVPDDLDTKPNRDEHDLDLLRRLEAAVRRRHVPPARSLAAVGGAVRKVRPISRRIATKRLGAAPSVGSRRYSLVLQMPDAVLTGDPHLARRNAASLRKRRPQVITVLIIPTPNYAAARRRDSPPSSTVAPTRSRRSME